MAKQTINVGTVANDGTGDTIRGAMNKVNSNFTELYTTFDINGQLSNPVTDAGTSETGVPVQYKLAYYIGQKSVAAARTISVDASSDYPKIGIGFPSTGNIPSSFAVSSSEHRASLQVFETSDTSTGPALVLFKNRNEVLNPTAPIQDDYLGTVSIYQGLGATPYPVGRFAWFADNSASGSETVKSRAELYTNTDSGLEMIFSTTSDGKLNIAGEYSLPKVDGTSGQTLVTDGEGTLSWADAASGGTSYDQSLNTTDTPTFRGLYSQDSAIAIRSAADGIEGYFTFYGAANTRGVVLMGSAPTETVKGADVGLYGGANYDEYGATGAGGSVNIIAGQGGNENWESDGGHINMYAGPSAHIGGNINILAGSTYSAGVRAGNILMQAGSADSGLPGNVTIEAGVSTQAPAFNGTMSLEGKTITLRAVDKIILAGGDIGGAGGYLKLARLSDTDLSQMAGDSLGAGTIFYNTTHGTLQVNTSDSQIDLRSIPNTDVISLDTLKSVVAASADFADFQSRIAAL